MRVGLERMASIASSSACLVAYSSEGSDIDKMDEFKFKIYTVKH